MGMHRLPYRYTIRGKLKGKKASKYDDGIERATGLDAQYFYIKEASEIDTTVVGRVTKGEAEVKVIYYDNKFWIKDAYDDQTAEIIQDSIRNCRTALQGPKSLFLATKLNDEQVKMFLAGELRDESQVGFHKIVESEKEAALDRTTKFVEENLIEIDGEVYHQVDEPVVELAVSRHAEADEAWLRVAWILVIGQLDSASETTAPFAFRSSIKVD